MTELCTAYPVETQKVRRLQKSRFRDIDVSNSILWNLMLITVGSVICVWAVNGILAPMHFLSGGLMGASLIIHYLTPEISLGLLFFLLNIPIFILGWMHVGRRFFFYSIYGVCVFTGAVEWLQPVCPVEDKMLGALLGGVVMGLGCGIILRSQGSAGGTDILSVILLKKFSVRLGSSVMFINVCIMTVSAFLFSLEDVLYTMIYMFVNTRVVDFVVTGFSQRKAVMIISPHWEAISQVIMNHMNRGVTLIPSVGGYSKKNDYMLYTIVTIRDIGRLKEVISKVDPNPFVVISDTLEVVGQRIGNQPHW